MWKLAPVALWAALSACRAPEPPTSDEPVNEPAVSNPLRQGFTQRPAPDTPGLPPPVAPVLEEREVERARRLRTELEVAELALAQQELERIVRAIEVDSDARPSSRLREAAMEFARTGHLEWMPVSELYASYLFPNDPEAVDLELKGQFVLLTGTVAPHNMKDFADGFKLIEQNPYVHDPLLLATDYELSFVECRLVHPHSQKLRDWQPIHFIAEVAGKRRSDVLLTRCIVL